MSGNVKRPMVREAKIAESADAALRERAEGALLGRGEPSPAWFEALSPADAWKMQHELRVHQIELEMQNEELRRAQLELDASRARYFDLYDLAPVGYCTVDEPGRVIDANLTLVTLLGVSRSALLGRPFSDFVLKEDQDPYFVLRRRLIETNKPQSCELRMRHADATPFWAHLAATMAQDAAGAGVFRVAVSDISALKQAEAARASAEDQLRESQKMQALGTLAGGVAHEFNNLLLIIMGNVELADMDAGLGPQTLTRLTEIRQATVRGKALVQQILAFGRRNILSLNPIALAPVVEEAARLLRVTLPAQVDLRVECAPHAPLVQADASHLVQVLINLVNNAWQAPMRGARSKVIAIRLDTHVQTGEPAPNPQFRYAGNSLSPGRYARLSVRDNGAGMDPATMRRLFEPFYTTKRVGEGAGLGLAVVFGIMQEHGASIAVESVPGEGSAFHLYFPVSKTQVPVAPQPAVPVPDGPQVRALGGQGKHILYIDDDNDVLRTMTQLLGREGYRVSAYSDPQKALDAARTDPGRYDLVVTDYSMPCLTGMEVARALIAMRADLPVAILTGYAAEALAEEARAIGVRAVLVKPDTFREMMRSIARLVQPT